LACAGAGVGWLSAADFTAGEAPEAAVTALFAVVAGRFDSLTGSGF
jgi:hypothetical protein